MPARGGRFALGFVAVAGMLAGMLAAVPVQGAPPAPYTAPQVVTGTHGEFNHLSATAPDGTDVVIWIQQTGSSDLELLARVRRPGSPTWKPVPPGIKNRESLQDIAVAPIGAGDFQVAWVEYNASSNPKVFTARLSTRKRTWSPVTTVFTNPGYDNAVPRIGVRPDGTVVIAATAQPIDYPSPPVYRTVVGVRRPGGVFVPTFLSAADEHSAPYSVVAGAGGQTLVTFETGYNNPQRAVEVATLGRSAGATWNVTQLTNPGESARSYGAMGPGGEAAVVYTTDAAGTYNLLRLSTATIGAGTPTWTTQTVASGGGTTTDGRAVVARDGDVTVLWNANASGESRLTVRTLRDGVFDPAIPISEVGRLATAGTFAQRADGKAELLFGLYTSSPVNELGLRMVTLSNGVPGPVRTLTTAADGSHNQFALGLDAASRGNVVWVRGFPPPDTDILWSGQSMAKPAVMTGPSSGKSVKRAKLVKRPHHRLRCESGLWVEASKLKYRWLKDGKTIRSARKSVYRWDSTDQGHKLRCKVTGKSKAAHKSRTIKSKARRVG